MVEVDGNYLAQLEYNADRYREARNAATRAFALLGIPDAGSYTLPEMVNVLANAVTYARRHAITSAERVVDAAHGE